MKDGVRHDTVAAVAAAHSKQRKKQSGCHKVAPSLYRSESSSTLSCFAAAVRYHKVHRARYEHESTQERVREHSPTLALDYKHEHSSTRAHTNTRALEHEHDHSSTPAHTNTWALEHEHRTTSTRRTRARAQALEHEHEVARQSVLDVSSTSCKTRLALFSPRT